MNTSYNRIRILLADDHVIFREGFATLFKGQHEIELIGEAENGKELVELTGKLQPDLVLTDIKMPVMNGVDATRKIVSHFPHIFVVALTMFEEERLIMEMLESGAKGYLLKNANKDIVFEAIKKVYKGESYFCKNTSAKLFEMIPKANFNPYNPGSGDQFSRKELEIIQLICQEFSNKEIASKFELSVRTIEGYRERIQEKMKVRNAAGIVVYAIRNGIFKIF